MKTDIKEIDSKYLSVIKKALLQLYCKDKALFEERNGSSQHEQTFSFRIALYLQNALKDKNNLFIDCEYHGAYKEKDNRKKVRCSNGKWHRVRPDIIYHDRKEDNIFCIEIKKKSLKEKDSKNVIQYLKNISTKRDFVYII